MDEELQKEMNALLLHETEQMKRKFGDLKNASDPLSIMKSLSGKDPVQILVEVYETCMNYLSHNQRMRYLKKAIYKLFCLDVGFLSTCGVFVSVLFA